MLTDRVLIKPKQILHSDHHHPWTLDPNKRPQIESLLQSQLFLKDFSDTSFSAVAAGYGKQSLESRIRDASLDAEDILESHLVEQILSCQEDESFVFSPPDLEKVIRELDSAKEEMMTMIMSSSPIADSSSPALPSRQDPNPKDIIVGVGEDLIQLKDRLVGQPSKALHIESQVGYVRGFLLSNITSTMGDLQVIGGIKKLNNNNYNSWSTCIMSYMQGQDLWEVVNGNEVIQPEAEDANGMLRKWKIKAGKAMFILKTTIEEEVLEHIRETKTPKEAWDTFAKLFSKKNDTKLQLIESELLSVAQRDLTVAQYFHKVKSLCREISELDPEAPIGEARMKRIIIHGLKPEFRSFVAAVQGWPNSAIAC
ncbi:UNVERIFIED_CONTAM: hypothetical protein Sradi_3486000 [Sesamum radiatum]|uniref:Retrotransposon gag domain-containing protein n=1 Tax=Sesamum radiatum TaxID=300843 RepID=A0AAW2QDL0_SESRA